MVVELVLSSFALMVGFFWLFQRHENQIREYIEHQPKKQWNEDDPEFMAHVDRQAHNGFDLED